ncbi:MAG: hypothetical protein AVDCRST_MAG12-2492, partial [uncultured Rubrobacteraceae bacterium]
EGYRVNSQRLPGASRGQGHDRA